MDRRQHRRLAGPLGAAMLALGLAAGLAVPGQGQETVGAVRADALAERARTARSAEAFAAAVAGLVRVAHLQPGQSPAVVSALTGFVRGGDPVRRGVTVDALRFLPPRTRDAMVPILADLLRSQGEGPAAGLFVRGLAEAGAGGLEALRQLMAANELRGDAVGLAAMYLRSGS